MTRLPWLQELEESTERYHSLHEQQQASQRVYEGQLRELETQLSSLHGASYTAAMEGGQGATPAPGQHTTRQGGQQQGI